jgi:hypothetical protein
LTQGGCDGLIVNTGDERQKRIPRCDHAGDFPRAHDIKRVGGIQRAVSFGGITEIDAEPIR